MRFAICLEKRIIPSLLLLVVRCVFFSFSSYLISSLWRLLEMDLFAKA